MTDEQKKQLEEAHKIVNLTYFFMAGLRPSSLQYKEYMELIDLLNAYDSKYNADCM